MNIVQIFPGKIWGGAEQYVLDLGQSLVSLGYNVSYIARPSNQIQDRLKGIIPCYVLPMSLMHSNSTVNSLRKILSKADIVHLHSFDQVSLISKICKKENKSPKIILTYHLAKASRIPFFRRKYVRNVDRIIFVSDFAMRLWYSVNSWMDYKKCVAILNGIPPTKADSPSELRNKYHITAETPLLIYTGRVRKSKGCMNIIKALSLIKDEAWEMIFVGACKPSNFSKKLMKLACRLRINERIHFYGFSTDVRNLIREADIGIAPSLVREACHLSPMEFMQAGKCIIVSNNGAQPEYIINYKTGILINPKSIIELASSIRIVLNDRALRHSIGENARIYFNKNLSYSAFIDKILSVYR